METPFLISPPPRKVTERKLKLKPQVLKTYTFYKLQKPHFWNSLSISMHESKTYLHGMVNPSLKHQPIMTRFELTNCTSVALGWGWAGAGLGLRRRK